MIISGSDWSSKSHRIHETPVNPSSEEIAEKIRGWTDVCDKHHACPAVDDIVQLPDRLLFVGSEKTPCLRLCCTKKQLGRYVALSYCWGLNHDFKTTDTTISEYHNAIDEVRLPGTYRDAIRVVRALGIPYLWIDAFCIKQNSPDDWAEQSANMDTIYGKSYLTFCVSHARSVSEGFMHPRASAAARCGTVWSGNIAHGVYLTERPDTALYDDVLNDEPLNDRA